jgi:alpha-beta hydrolase superfamily lysophospholipase
VKVPTLILHPTADTEIRVRQAREMRDAAGSADVTYHELVGAPHYLEGYRRPALDLTIDWLRTRFA